MATVKLTDKPVAEALGDGDQLVLIQGGAVKRIAAELVGGKWPTLDLYAAGVLLSPEVIGSTTSSTYTVDAGLVTQIADAAKAGGALVKIGINADGLPVPVQAALTGSAIELAGEYQLSGKASFQGNMINVAMWVSPRNQSESVTISLPADPRIPLPETTNEGAFLRVQDGVWAAVQVPEAEEVSF